ncbi:DIP1984 family protein [Psychrobacter sp. I-STPA6b]|uniref:DIP1984 family protein n=1 Tax=Psychrobacter sp. I-STPA6b TaxID=2585718 RepID=UPI001D0C22DA|nr:DIP1984 family protein [Psychrobacter sp. I-STPA6b]
MKLAKALIIRGDLQKKLSDTKNIIQKNSVVHKESNPNIDPNEMIVKANQIIDELDNLMERIHRTNTLAKTSDGRTMLKLLTERDTLRNRHKLLTSTIESTTKSHDSFFGERYHDLENIKVTVPVADLQKQADDISMKIRHLNITIQENNWQIDLLD